MKHLIKLVPDHVRHLDGTEIKGEVASAQEKKSYHFQTSIPHFVNVDHRLGKVKPGEASMIFPAERELEIGDVLEMEEPYKWTGMVTQIIERRPVRGSWALPRPHFIKVGFM